MKSLILLTINPSKFFDNLKHGKGPKRNFLLYGLSFGAISQAVFYLVFILSDNSDIYSDFFYSESLAIKIFIFLLFVYIPTIFTILFREIFCWFLLKLMGVKGSIIRDIHKIICFTMISNIWLIIPRVGFFLSGIHLLVLFLFCWKIFYDLSYWKIVVITIMIAIINFLPLSYSF